VVAVHEKTLEREEFQNRVKGGRRRTKCNGSGGRGALCLRSLILYTERGGKKSKRGRGGVKLHKETEREGAGFVFVGRENHTFRGRDQRHQSCRKRGGLEL